MNGTPLISLLFHWTERFRSPELLELLRTGGDADLQALADGIMRSLASGQDAAGAIRALVGAGRFDTAEWAINQCPDLDEACVAALRQDLAERRAHAVQQTEALVAEQVAAAQGAELGCQLDRQRLVQLAVADRAAALTEIDKQDQEIRRHVRVEGEKLLAGLSPDVDPLLRYQCRAFLSDGNLRAARRLLEGYWAGRSWPSSVPRVDGWPWSEPPDKVLSWYQAPGALPRQEFARWRASSPEGLQVVEALWALRQGTAGAAGTLLRALGTFLRGSTPADGLPRSVAGGPSAETVSAAAPDGGWLGQLVDALNVGPGVPIVVQPWVDVYIAGRGETTAPEHVKLSTPFLVVGPDAARHTSRRRSLDAVLTMEDLLLLVRQDSDRPLHLLRIAGAQWPLSMVSAGSPEELRRLFDEVGPGEADQVSALAWVLDLAGCKASAVPDAIVQETALVPELVDIFLRLVDQPADDQVTLAKRVQSWVDDPLVTAGIQGAVLAPFGDPRAQLALWALFAEGSSPGSNVDPEDVIFRAEMSSPEAVEVVREQLGALARSPLVQAVDGGGWRLRPCGVTTYLVGQADSQLDELLPRALRAAREARRVSRSLLAWNILRHAALPGYPTAEAAIAHGGAEAEQAVRRLDAEAERTPVGTLAVAGRCDLDVVLDDVVSRFRAGHTAVELTVVTPGQCPLPFRPEVLQSMLYELIERATNSFRDGAGKILVEWRRDPEFIEVEVRDDGPGIAVLPNRIHQLLVRPGLGDDLDGLRRARALAQFCQGDIVILSPSEEHLIYPGALVQLVLPRR